MKIDISYTIKEVNHITDKISAIRSWSDKVVLIGLYLSTIIRSLLRDILKVNLLDNKLQAGIKSRSF